MVQFKQGRHAQAVNTLEEAAALAPEVAVIRYHLGAAYEKAGKPNKARRNLEKAVSLEPDAEWLSDARALLANL